MNTCDLLLSCETKNYFPVTVRAVNKFRDGDKAIIALDRSQYAGGDGITYVR